MQETQNHFDIFKHCYKKLGGHNSDKLEIEGGKEEALIKQKLGPQDIYKTCLETDKKVTVPDYQNHLSPKPSRILICAPSNAAIDEICRILR